jgi:hypothetical protein
VGLVESEYLLATTGRGNGRRDGRQLAMTQDARNHRLLGDGSNDPQCATSAKRQVARPGVTASAQRVCALPSAHTVAEDRSAYPGQRRVPVAWPSSNKVFPASRDGHRHPAASPGVASPGDQCLSGPAALAAAVRHYRGAGRWNAISISSKTLPWASVRYLSGRRSRFRG